MGLSRLYLGSRRTWFSRRSGKKDGPKCLLVGATLLICSPQNRKQEIRCRLSLTWELHVSHPLDK